MNIKTKLVPITWLHGIPHGHSCGYVGVPAGHPWHGLDYYGTTLVGDITIHGGVTWADDYVPHQPDCDSALGYWWVGFDTAHARDNATRCNESYCRAELDSLTKQAVNAALGCVCTIEPL